MIVEYGHIYVDDIISGSIDTDDILSSIDIAKFEISKRGGDARKVVLIDDKNWSLTDQEKINMYKNIFCLYDELGMKPDEIYFEKSFELYFNNFYRLLPKDDLIVESFRRDEKRVEFIKNECDGSKIPIRTMLDNGLNNLTCQFLSTIWLLHKKSISNGSSITILNEKYKLIEDQVDSIIKKMSLDVENTNIYY